MTRVWYAVPSARPAADAQACFDAWRRMGYAVAATRKEPDLDLDRLLCLPKYPGLWCATNHLARVILEDDPECEVVVTGGDDVFPDPSKRAEEIADEFAAYFNGTLGVMQPVKDQPNGHGGRAWSPWLGREWCERAFEGRGATEPAFWHYFGDAYLYDVTHLLGRLWARNDVKHRHLNWKELRVARPAHLAKSKDMWQADHDLYHQLRAAGYPGSGLLPA